MSHEDSYRRAGAASAFALRPLSPKTRILIDKCPAFTARRLSVRGLRRAIFQGHATWTSPRPRDRFGARSKRMSAATCRIGSTTFFISTTTSAARTNSRRGCVRASNARPGRCPGRSKRTTVRCRNPRSQHRHRALGVAGVCAIETTQVAAVAFDDVGEAFTAIEGEGDGSCVTDVTRTGCISAANVCGSDANPTCACRCCAKAST